MKLIFENWKRFLIKENDQVEMAKRILSKVDASHPDVKDDISGLLNMLGSGKYDDSVSAAIKHYSKNIQLSPEEQKFVDSLPEPKPMGSILDNPDVRDALSNIQNKLKD